MSPWVLDQSQPAELPAGGAEFAGVISELRNGGKDGEREQAVPSTSSSGSPSCLHVVLSSHICQTAWRQLLNCHNLSLCGPEGTNMAVLGPMVPISTQAGADSPALSCVVIASGTALPPGGTITCPSSAHRALAPGDGIPWVRIQPVPGPPRFLAKLPLWSCPASPAP